MTDTRVAIGTEGLCKPTIADKMALFLWMMLISLLKENRDHLASYFQIFSVNAYGMIIAVVFPLEGNAKKAENDSGL